MWHLSIAGRALPLPGFLAADSFTCFSQLNLQVQELGTYLQSSILQLNFWTDAFGQLREGSGRAVDGKAAEQWWYSEWLNFGQSWWYELRVLETGLHSLTFRVLTAPLRFAQGCHERRPWTVYL